ncbi:hypothetical protein LPJ70_007106, partial [Coemansia sp. RSA 2708]
AQALSTPEAVFNNRFVRVLRAVGTSQPAGAPTTAADSATTAAAVPAAAAPMWRPKSAAIKKAELIEKYVEQQKDLMKKLTSTPDMPAPTRKIIMDSIKQIQQKIDESRQPKAVAPPATAASTSVPVAATAAADSTSAEPETAASDNAAQLDAVASEKAALQSKLKTLQEQAARLGMNERGMRGRGRGRGGAPAWAGRGAMSLDKRPRSLVFRNVSQEAAEQLPSEMSQFGEIEHIDKLDDQNNAPFTYTVKFKARWEAEKALKAVEALDLFTNVKVDWEATS